MPRTGPLRRSGDPVRTLCRLSPLLRSVLRLSCMMSAHSEKVWPVCQTKVSDGDCCRGVRRRCGLTTVTSKGFVLFGLLDQFNGYGLNGRRIPKIFQPMHIFKATKPCHLSLGVVTVRLLRQRNCLFERD